MLPKWRILITFVLSFIILSLTFIWHRNSSIVVSTDGKPSYRHFNSTAPLPLTPFAIATFLTGQGTDDAYFQATRLMGYTLHHASQTRIDPTLITFLVLCSPSTSDEQKRQLQKEGATVIEVDDVSVNWWIRTSVRRWKEQFTKLRLFEITEYQRILLMDADTMILEQLDSIFEESELVTMDPTLDYNRKDDEAPLPPQWKFAARSDAGYGGGRDHPIPPLQTSFFGAGFILVAPNKQIFMHLISVMSHWRRFDPYTMEQSLLNYVFRRGGPMPWRDLHWRWSATWPSERDIEKGVVTLHDKMWNNGPQPLQDMWHEKTREMQMFFEHHSA